MPHPSEVRGVVESQFRIDMRPIEERYSDDLRRAKERFQQDSKEIKRQRIVNFVEVGLNHDGSTPLDFDPNALPKAIMPPTLRSKPVIIGNPKVGQTLSCTNGRWTGAQSFSYVWRRDGGYIYDGEEVDPNSLNSTFMVTQADAGSHISVWVTAENSKGNQSSQSDEVFVKPSVPV